MKTTDSDAGDQEIRYILWKTKFCWRVWSICMWILSWTS